MLKKEAIFIGVLLPVLIAGLVALGLIWANENLGAPQRFVATQSTSTSPSNFSFAIGTSSSRGIFGTSTLAVYGSSTVHTWQNTLHGFEVFDSVSSTVFRVDTINRRASSSAFVVSNLLSCDTIDTNGDGILACGSDATGAGGGVYPFIPTSFGGTEHSASTTRPFYFGMGLLTSSSTVGTLVSGSITATSSLTLSALSQVPLYANSAGLVISAGTGVNGNCVQWGANNLLSDAGSACGSGSGGSAPFPVATFGGTVHAASSTLPFYFGQGLLTSSSTIGTLTFGTGSATSSFSVAGHLSASSSISVAASSTFSGALNVGGLLTSNGLTITPGSSLTINSEAFTNLLGSGLVNTAGVLTPVCATITGGAGLCDGDDATGGGGSGVPNLIYSTSSISTTGYYMASSTLGNNRSFYFRNGLVSAASSTFMGHLLSSAFYGTSTGAATTPIFSFVGDSNTGIYSTGADNLAITTGGVLRFDIDATDAIITVPIRSSAGTAAAPAYSDSAATAHGMSVIGSGPTNVSFSGTESSVSEDFDFYAINSGGAGADSGNLTLNFYLEDTNSNNQEVADLTIDATDASDTTEDSSFGLDLIRAGVEVSVLDINHSQSGILTGGFSSTTPWGLLSIEQQTVAIQGQGPTFVIGDDSGATSTIFIVDGKGFIGIATNTPGTRFGLVGNAVLTGPVTVGAFTGTSTALFTGLTAGAAGDDDICQNPTTEELTDAGGAACLVSSIRFKENIVAQTTALTLIKALNPVVFTYKPELDHSLIKGVQHYGLIAEEVELIDKRLVGYADDGSPWTVRYEEMVSVVVRAIQELIGWNDEQDRKIEALEKRILELEARLK